MKKKLKFSDVGDFKRELLKDASVKKEYDRLESRYTLIRQVLDARIRRNLSQKDVAKKMGTKQSAIARFESGNINPTLSFIERLSRAIKTPLTISVSG